MTVLVDGDILVGPQAAGPLLALEQPVSFWGGVDPATGRIVDRSHPQFGTALRDAVVLMRGSRGSSSSSSTLLECVRRGTAPAALLLTERDALLVIGAVCSWELYDRGPTIVIVPDAVDLTGCARVEIDGSGRVEAWRSPAAKPWSTES